jgi:hypothetical protein
VIVASWPWRYMAARQEWYQPIGEAIAGVCGGVLAFEDGAKAERHAIFAIFGVLQARECPGDKLHPYMQIDCFKALISVAAIFTSAPFFS